MNHKNERNSLRKKTFHPKDKKRFSVPPQKNKPPRRVLKIRTPEEEPNDGNLMRLNRYIANSGLCSRREADDYILSGLVSVNGKIVTTLGVKVSPDDIVRFNNAPVKPEKMVYLLLNKPKDYITTMDDPHATKTVMDLIKNACRERVYPVGRLDRNTLGVLLMTNDGELTKKLTHPKYKARKIYHVFLDKNLKRDDMEKIASGIELDDGPISADEISYIDPDDKKQVGIEIHSGRNRIIRRIFEHLGYRIYKLDRVYFAGLTKKNLTRGHWRFLSDKEVNLLKMNRFM